ncbi:MAG: hypothetical protein ABSD49_06170 [Candidatus Bathyarchaeia archaeon]
MRLLRQHLTELSSETTNGVNDAVKRLGGSWVKATKYTRVPLALTEGLTLGP